MSEHARDILDRRFAAGEISEAQYRQMCSALRNNRTTSSEFGGAVGGLFSSVKKAVMDHIDNQPAFGFDLGRHTESLNESTPFEVTDDLSLYASRLIYKGESFPLSAVEHLDFTGSSSSVNGINDSLYSLTIYLREIKPISVTSMTFLIGRTKKGKRICDASRLLCSATFRQRMDHHIKAMQEKGYTDFDGVRVYPNGDVEQGSTRINIADAANNNTLLLGTFVKTGLLGTGHNSDPNEIIIGDGGTSILSRRIKFRVTLDKDVKMTLLRRLAKI